ncbi:serine/threonine protein kinase [Spirochaeta africana]|uniref:Protein kinase family protein n=1 Tax=Spirochaeta africana (strain ATCC 700263 / DSM 8902 / Z-7692) TaxID=889378 RepID=H9UMX7_SPIAZ|nr:serine/threonine-protein kinase [Spirochaeta africana]AFG38870.1 protein kinase family protein [Spirochaeta africana DSM 8902]
MAAIPERIGKYKIISQLATGGMGAVYKAQHPTLQQELVIKKLTMLDSSHVRERFRREAQIMFNFKSDYIVDVYDHFREGKAYHIVQEYIDGISLEDLIERERYLPEHIALRIMLYAARALKYAHSRNVVHRDIKPGNILISRRGTVKLVDFGIASIRDRINDEDLTQIGMTLGTPSYMAPEQFTSSRDVDKRADIYSLGVMLYEMLTGKKPFPGTKLPETYQRIIKGKYRNPRRINPNISRFSLRLLKKTMQPKLRRRYRDMQQVIRRLERHLRIKPVIGVPFESADMLADFVAGKRTWPRNARVRIGQAAGIAAAALLLIWGSSGILRLGYHQRLLQPGLYGSVSLQLQSAMDPQELSRLPIDARLTSEQFPALQYDLPLRRPLRNLAPIQQLPPLLRPDALPNSLVTLPRYIRSGRYRLELQVGSQQYHQLVYVHARERQFPEPRRQNQNHFVIEHASPAPRPLRISSVIRDQLSGTNITPLARVEALHGGRFQSVESLTANQQLLSGEEIHFRISRAGYYSQELQVSSRPGETELELRSALVPRSGQITIATTDSRTSLRINNSRSYIQGGMNPRDMRIPPLDPDQPITLQLPPGRYTLQSVRGFRQGNELGINLTSDQHRYFLIEFLSDEDIFTLSEIQEGELP